MPGGGDTLQEPQSQALQCPAMVRKDVGAGGCQVDELVDSFIHLLVVWLAD